MPNFLDRNLSIIAEQSPELAAAVLGASDLPDGNFALESTPEGAPSCRGVADGRWVHSARAPVAEARRLVDSLKLGQRDLVVVLGGGLGYALDALLEKLSEFDFSIIALEQEPALLRAALSRMDVYPYLTTKHLNVIDATDRGRAALQINNALTAMSGRLVFLKTPGAHALHSRFYDTMRGLIEKTFEEGVAAPARAAQASQRRRTLVAGFDGAEWSVLRPLMDKGLMPAFSALCARGASGPLLSTLPPHSAPAWTAFFTGRPPQESGIYAFDTPNPDYSPRVVQGSDVHGLKLWQWTDRRGLKTVLVNLPFTYPPEPLNGAMISGLPAVDFSGWPPDIQNMAAHHVIRGFLEFGMQDMVLEDFIYNQLRRDRITLQLALDLLNQIEWNLAVVVFTGLDRLQHYFWHTWDAAHPTRAAADWEPFTDAIPRHYRFLDAALAALLERAGADAPAMVLSDHGFGPSLKLLNVNRLLARGGFLAFAEDGSPDMARTRAFHALHQGAHAGVMINDTARFDRGTVPPADVPAAAREVAAFLSGLSYAGGAAVFDEVTAAPYGGNPAPGAPDVIAYVRHSSLSLFSNNDPEYAAPLVFAPGETIGATLPLAIISGQHCDPGILAAAAPGIAPGADTTGAAITGVFPLICHALGIPIPDTLRARLPEHIFTPGHLQRNPPQTAPAEIQQPAKTESAPDDDTEERQKQILKGLGYL